MERVFKRKIYDRLLQWKQTRDGKTAILIEVHTSLDEFCKKYSSVVDKRYLIYTKDLQKDEEVLMMPVYLTSLI